MSYAAIPFDSAHILHLKYTHGNPWKVIPFRARFRWICTRTRNPSRNERDIRGEELGEKIASLSAKIQAATYELLVLLREFDEVGGWAEARSQVVRALVVVGASASVPARPARRSASPVRWRTCRSSANQ